MNDVIKPLFAEISPPLQIFIENISVVGCNDAFIRALKSQMKVGGEKGIATSIIRDWRVNADIFVHYALIYRM